MFAQSTGVRLSTVKFEHLFCPHAVGMSPTPDSQAPLTFADTVDFLSRASSYPETTRSVEVIETHMAMVFLTDRHAYKLKKPIRRDRCDFSSLAARHRDCVAEVRLNRRLAPTVYLGTVPVLRTRTGLRIGGISGGETVDWLVKMTRLPRDLMLDVALRQGQATEDALRQLARVLAHFYLRAKRIEIAPKAYPVRLTNALEDTCRALRSPRYGIDQQALEALHTRQLERITLMHEPLMQRVRQSRIVEAHGDLRPEHICLMASPVIIDCLEFDADLRSLDPVDELTGLCIECEYLQADWVESPILETYSRVTGDVVSADLLGLYRVQRALLRARLAAWHLDDESLSAANEIKWRNRAADFIQMAGQPSPRERSSSQHSSRMARTDSSSS